jgi:hypothetical protein
LLTGFFYFNFILLCIIPFAVGIGKSCGQPSLVFLSIIAGAFGFFILINSVELQKIWLFNQAIKERKAYYARHIALEEERKEQNRQRDIEIEPRALEIMPEVCKKSGEIIHRKAESVDGVLVLNNANYYFSRYGQRVYRYYDNLDIRSGQWGRMETGRWEKMGELKALSYGLLKTAQPVFLEKDADYQRYIDDFIKIIAPNHATPRYAVDGHGSSVNEGIYNLSLKVIDLQTKEVMAEWVSYQYDGTHHKEVDWGETPRKCPPQDEMEFVKKVLQPSPYLAQ